MSDVKASKLPLQPLDYIPPEIVSALDYELLASHFIEAKRLAYLAGGSGLEKTLQQNRKVFDNYAITPRLMQDVSHASCRTSLLGFQFKSPMLLAPVAYQALVHPEAELATAKGAAAMEMPMIASTLSSQSLEDIAAASEQAKWFQLYIQPRQSDTDNLIQRAVEAGYQAIVVTMDAALQAPSYRAMKAGFELPETIKAANLQQQQPVQQKQGNAAQSRIFLNHRLANVTQAQLAEVVEKSPLPVLVKGVLHPEDALALKQVGVAGLVVSNHGGRSMDSAPASLSVLPEIRQTVGHDFPLLFDSGIRSGSDIFKAIALGADAVLIGRLQIYALSVAGALGVAHMLRLLKEELELTMAMTGCSSVAEIKTSQLRLN